MSKWVIGIDLGGTKIEGATVELSGKIDQCLHIETNVKGGPEVIAAQIFGLIDKLSKKAPGKIEGIGVGIPGQIDPSHRTVIFAPNLYWKNVPFHNILSKQTSYPVFIDNDVRNATRGEIHFGEGQSVKNFVSLLLGTGIGGGIVLNGSLMTGTTNSAGELGHIVVKYGGSLCSCGNRGCLEAYASGWAIAKAATLAVEKSPENGAELLRLANGHLITAELVFEAFRRNDRIAKKVVQEATRALIAGAVSIVNAWNPERLIIGGGLLKGFPHFLEAVDAGVRKQALTSALSNLQVIHSQCPMSPALLGAASLPLFGY